MASLTRWTWVSVNSGSWWWTGRPGMLQFMGSQRVGHDWATELNWTERYTCAYFCSTLPQKQNMFVERNIIINITYCFPSWKDDAVKVLHSICQPIWKTQQWPQDGKRSVFIPIPKKDNAKECSNYHTIALISHTSKLMLKILQARL